VLGDPDRTLLLTAARVASACVVPVDLTGETDPELSRVVILREPGFVEPFFAALSDSSDPSVRSETIVVVAPTPGLADLVRSMTRGVRVIDCPIDLGTAAAWNLAVGAARSPWIALLHEDTVLAPGWEELMGLLRNRGVGVVGPRLVNSDGSTQCTGWVVFRDGRCVPIDDRTAATTSEARRSDGLLDVDLVSSACMVFATDTWRRLGGFDERYFPAVGVDVDFCLAVRESGLRVVCTDRVKVVHASGAMMRADRAHGDRALRTFLIRRNHALLGRQWAPVLERRPPFPDADDELRMSVGRYWKDSLFEIASDARGPRVADRSITGFDQLIDDRVPEEVSFRAASRRTEVLEDCIAWSVREAMSADDEVDAPRECPHAEGIGARLAAIERSRTWKVRGALVRLLPHRWRSGRL